MGDVYKFPDKKAARLHPVAQLYDVYAADSMELAAQYGRDEAEVLLRFAEGRDRSRLVDAFETWKSDPASRMLPFEARDLAWRLLLGRAQEPPADSTEIVRVIEEDRRAVENGIRSRPESANPGEFSPFRSKERQMSEAEKKARAARVSDDAVIKVLVDANPKRAGSKAFTRFEAYKNGMTVKQARDAGLTAADISYDSKHNHISVTAPAAA
jgi:hypothetical protein